MNALTNSLTCCFLILLLALLGESRSKENAHAIYDGHFDYVIVGGGTAGLVIASRLSEDPSVTVAVIEAGDFEGNNPNVTNTTALGIGQGTDLDWQYQSVPQEFAGNKSLIWRAGKGLGGSSLINGMTYIRPASSQIDLWPSLGLEIDWQILFNSSKYGESFQPPSAYLQSLGACYETRDHGFHGPLSTCISPHMTSGDIHEIFNTTFQSIGIPPRCEFNGGELRGFGVQMVTQDGIADIREDSARAYYYPVADRPNLVVLANTTGTRILWAEDAANGNAVAAGIEIQDMIGAVSVVYAGREVVLSAGAIRSPAILEHSGVGNSKSLSKYAIDVKVDLPSVGENLQDQTVMAVLAAALQPSADFPAFVAHASLQDLYGPGSQQVYDSVLAKLPEYAATIAAQNGGSSSAAVQERILKTQLDLLLNSNTPTSEIAPGIFGELIGCVFWPLQPFSRGSVHINSTNTTAIPAIDGKFLQFDFDGKVAVDTARLARKFLTTAPTSSLVNMTTLQPSFDVVPEDASDDVWLEWLTNSVAPNYHHLGTCAMLPKDMGGVVDNDFKVYGTRNVRVVDLSVIPLQVAGHSTSLVYAVAEWAAQKIR